MMPSPDHHLVLEWVRNPHLFFNFFFAYQSPIIEVASSVNHIESFNNFKITNFTNEHSIQ